MPRQSLLLAAALALAGSAAAARVHKSRSPAAVAPVVVSQAPEQIRLVFTNSDTEMGVYFVT